MRWAVQSVTSIVRSRASMFGGGPSGTTTTNTSPWSGQQPFLTTGFNAAQNLYQPGNANAGGPQYFPGQTLAGPTAAQTGGLQQTANLGLGGSAPGNAASNAITGVLNGSPAMTSSIAAQVMPQIEGQFAGGNRLDSGLASQAVGSGMTNAILQNQLNYANAGMNANQMQLGGAEAAAQAGQGQQQLNQASINDAIQRWNYNQQLPFSNLNNYASLIQGNYGGATTSPYFQNTLGQIGAAAGGLGSLALGLGFL